MTLSRHRQSPTITNEGSRWDNPTLSKPNVPSSEIYYRNVVQSTLKVRRPCRHAKHLCKATNFTELISSTIILSYTSRHTASQIVHRCFSRRWFLPALFIPRPLFPPHISREWSRDFFWSCSTIPCVNLDPVGKAFNVSF